MWCWQKGHSQQQTWNFLLIRETKEKYKRTEQNLHSVFRYTKHKGKHSTEQFRGSWKQVSSCRQQILATAVSSWSGCSNKNICLGQLKTHGTTDYCMSVPLGSLNSRITYLDHRTCKSHYSWKVQLPLTDDSWCKMSWYCTLPKPLFEN